MVNFLTLTSTMLSRMDLMDMFRFHNLITINKGTGLIVPIKNFTTKIKVFHNLQTTFLKLNYKSSVVLSLS